LAGSFFSLTPHRGLSDHRGMRARAGRLWRTVSARRARPLPPTYVLRAYAERRARSQRDSLPRWGLGLVLVVAIESTLVRWVSPQADRRFAFMLASQVAVILVAIALTRRRAQRPEGVRRVATAMLLALVVSGAIHHTLLPGPPDGFASLAIVYLLTARALLGDTLVPHLAISTTCVVAHVVVLAVAGFPLPIILADAAVLALASAMLLVGSAVRHQDALERLYRREMNRVAFTLASRNMIRTEDIAAAVREIIELAGQTLAVTRAEVWLLDGRRTAMRCIDGYERAPGARRARADVALGEHRGYVRDLDQEPLVQSYGPPAPASASSCCPHLAGVPESSALEAGLRIRGRTGGVLCFQQEGRRRSWNTDEERFASYMAHLVSLAIEASERHHAEAALHQVVAALEDRSGELSRTVGILNQHIVERSNVERQLRESRTQLRRLSTRLLQIQEEERRRIAREIHDELGQTLTALQLDLAWLGQHLDGGPASVPEKVERMSSVVDATLESVQAIARNLRPALIDDLGLVAALEWQIREFEKRAGIPCRLTVEHDEITLDTDRSITVFRLVQEALTNVVRHAGATRVAIALRDDGGRLLVKVRDNGRGIRRHEMARHDALGLVGMRERVHLFGGRLRIEGRAGRGTLIRAEIPVRDPAHATTEGPDDPHPDRRRPHPPAGGPEAHPDGDGELRRGRRGGKRTRGAPAPAREPL